MTDKIEPEVAEMQLALGRAISAWAAIEGTLCSTFCIAVTATDRDAAARAFTAILSFEVQLAVTRAAMAVSYRLDPPMKGGFKDGVGTFYGEDTPHGKPVRARFIWSNITPTTCHWEQADSPDGGKTWETNWVQDIRRAP